MDWVINNVQLLPYLVFAVMLVLVFASIFVNQPREQQLEVVQHWLLWAVTKAEQELKGKTGAIKLAYVYDMFVQKFPVAAKMVSYETFSVFVDQALTQLRFLIDTNENVKAYVEGEM